MKAIFALASIALSKASTTSEVQGRFLEQAGTEITVQFNGAPVTAFDVNGQAFFGDILLGNTEEVIAKGVKLINPEEPQTESVSVQAGQYWPNGKVPYKFSRGLPAGIKRDFEFGVRAWNSQISGVNLYESTGNERAYIEVITGQGCYSALGRTGSKQPINLASNCGGPTAIHEIGHAMGWYHEQARSDRDQFIRVNYSNIERAMHSQYDIARGARLIGDYDYYSIMHYPDWGFSTGGKTFTPIQSGIDASRIGAARNMSPKDLAAARIMYPGGGGGRTPPTPTPSMNCNVSNCRQCSRNNYCSQCNRGYRVVNGRCQRNSQTPSPPTPSPTTQSPTTRPPGGGCNATCFKGCATCASPAWYHCLSCCSGYRQQGSTCAA